MNINKLDPMLCLAFDLYPEGPYPVSTFFGELREFHLLSREEIDFLSECIFCTHIRIEDTKKDRRWRERTTPDRRKNRE